MLHLFAFITLNDCILLAISTLHTHRSFRQIRNMELSVKDGGIGGCLKEVGMFTIVYISHS